MLSVNQKTKLNKKIGIIAGGGDLPLRITQALDKGQRDYIVIALNNEATAATAAIAHYKFDLGSIGQILSALKEEQAEEIMLAGKIKRPSFSSLKVDAVGFKLLARITKAKLLGDDSLLRIVVNFLEEQGFKVVGAESILEQGLAPFGVITAKEPDEMAKADIAIGSNALRIMGDLDIGQAIIVENGLVLGVEAAEGTDNLIERCAKLKKETGRRGVLIKLKKQSQDARVDLPTIGIKTVENVYEAGLTGIALEHNGTIIIDQQQVIAKANELGLFIIGIS